MRKEALVRLGGWAAIAAGVLRAAGAFASDIGNDLTQQSLYFIIDVFLLIGVLAAYARDCEVMGRWGATGFLTALVGILLVRSSRAVPGLDLYPAGAVAVALGCALLGLTSWRAGTGSWWVPLLFILSVVTAIGGQAVTLSPAPFIVSGVIFGAAMVGLGKQVLDRRSSSGG